jgi:hypothetical protein
VAPKPARTVVSNTNLGPAVPLVGAEQLPSEALILTAGVFDCVRLCPDAFTALAGRYSAVVALQRRTQ